MFGKVRTTILMIGLTASGAAWAAWPDDKPVEVVVGFAAGGGTDVMARKLLPFVERDSAGTRDLSFSTSPVQAERSRSPRLRAPLPTPTQWV